MLVSAAQCSHLHRNVEVSITFMIKSKASHLIFRALRSNS